MAATPTLARTRAEVPVESTEPETTTGVTSSAVLRGSSPETGKTTEVSTAAKRLFRLRRTFCKKRAVPEKRPPRRRAAPKTALWSPTPISKTLCRCRASIL